MITTVIQFLIATAFPHVEKCVRKLYMLYWIPGLYLELHVTEKLNVFCLNRAISKDWHLATHTLQTHLLIHGVWSVKMFISRWFRFEERAPDPSRGHKNDGEPDPQETEEWVLWGCSLEKKAFIQCDEVCFKTSLMFSQALNPKRERMMANIYP